MFVCVKLSNFRFNLGTNYVEMRETTSGRIQILDSGDLLVSNVRESDAGLYTCMRSNEAGTVQGEAFLTVMGRFMDELPLTIL